MSRPDDGHHSIFPIGNPFRRLFPRSTYLPPSLLALLNAFEENLAARLERLKPSISADVCTMTWMRCAVESLSETHSDIKSLTDDLGLPVSEWDAEWITAYLDDSIKLLDISVALGSELSHLDQGMLFLRLAVNCLQPSSNSPHRQQLVEASRVLHDWVHQNNTRCPKFAYSSSIVQGLAMSLCPAKVKNSVKGKVLMRAMYGVKAHTIFVLSVFTCLLAASDGLLMHLPVPYKLPWSNAFKELTDCVYGETRDAVSGRCRSTAAFKELQAVYIQVQKLLSVMTDVGIDGTPNSSSSTYRMTDDSHEVSALPEVGIEQVKTDALLRLAPSLGDIVERFADALDRLSEEVRGFFQIVLSGRDALLCNLRATFAEEDGTSHGIGCCQADWCSTKQIMDRFRHSIISCRSYYYPSDLLHKQLLPFIIACGIPPANRDMDAGWSLVVVFTLSFPLLLLLSKYFTAGAGSKRPPCPPCLSVVDNILLFCRPLTELSPALRRLRARLGPAVTVNFFFSFPSVFVLDRRLAHEALVVHGAAFSDRPLPGATESVYSSNGHIVSSGRGALWRLLRRNLVSGVAHPSHLRSQSSIRRRALAALLADLRSQAVSGDGVVLLDKSFRRALTRSLVDVCFGDGLAEAVAAEIEQVQGELLAIGSQIVVYDMMPRVGKLLMWRTWRRFVSVRRRQEEIMLPLVAERRGSGKINSADSSYLDSLVDLVLPDEGSRRLTDVEIVSLCSEFLDAGIETTASAMEWAMANLVKYPHLQRRLFEEVAAVVPDGREMEEEDLERMPYLRAVILETLRRHPPAQFLLPHAASEDSCLGGYRVAKGTVLNFAVAEMGWDGEAWEAPFEFRPERFVAGGEGEGVDVTGSREIRMMPFGAGRRICPGIAMALLHLEFYLASLVREFEWRPRVDGEVVDLSETIDFAIVMKNPLRARIFPRQ